jgi:hypothetical protein
VTKYRRYEVPRVDESFFSAPPLEALSSVVEKNHALLEDISFSIGDMPFHEFRAALQQEVLAKAWSYTREIRATLPAMPWGQKPAPATGLSAPGEHKRSRALRAQASKYVIETGHQPQFAHPGIWIKNVLCHYIAAKVDGLGLNMIVDNDEASDCGIAMPCFSEGRPSRKTFPYHRGARGIAFEEAKVDEGLIKACRQHVLAEMPPELKPSLFEKLFDICVDKAEANEDLAFCLAAARRLVEEEFGVRNLEIPVSNICDSHYFLLFFLEMVKRADEYAAIYNETLDDYRRQFEITSPSHPLPNLSLEGGVVELPFWGWRPGAQRTSLYVKRRGGSVDVMLGDETVTRCEEGELADAWHCAGRLLRELSGKVKVRPRALTLTTYQRFFICDIFIHGIGGARYEQIADQIMERFFGARPPAYLVASGTLFLPFELHDVSDDDIKELEEELRELKHSPEDFLGENVSDEARALMEEKNSLINVGGSARARRRAFRRLKEVNRLLYEKAKPLAEKKRTALAKIKQRAEWNGVLGRRDYPFCIHPTEKLEHFFHDKRERIA